MFFDILKCEDIYKKEKANIIWNYEITKKLSLLIWNKMNCSC
jgi:hypothetical protein